VSRTRILFILLLVVAASLAAMAFRTSWQDVHQDGGTDLRCRVVGARAMLGGMNPYRLAPDSELPESLRDPDRPLDPRSSRCTYPPTLLAMYGVFARLPYPMQRSLWFALEWTALLVSILTLATCIANRDIRLAFVAMSLVFAAAAPSWRLHVERGHYYVFLVVLMAIAARRTIARNGDDWLAGVCLGLAVAMRPTLVVALILLWVLNWRRSAIAGVMTAGACVLLTLPMTGIGQWRDYTDVVRGWQNEVVFGDRSRVPPRSENTFVDGVDFRTNLDPENANLTSLVILGRLRRQFSLKPGPLWLVINNTLALIAVATPALFIWRRRSAIPPVAILAGSLMIAFLGEYFLPVRWGYADVLYVLPLALLLPYLWPHRWFLIAITTAMVVGEFAIHQGLASALVISLAWWALLLGGYRLALGAGSAAKSFIGAQV
jgi:hypothetical protein